MSQDLQRHICGWCQVVLKAVGQVITVTVEGQNENMSDKSRYMYRKCVKLWN